jgi:hypothetical protein
MAPALTIGLKGRFRNLVEHDGVERLSRRLDAHPFEHRLAPVMLERIAVHEGLRHGLDDEGAVGIADGIDLPVDRGDGDAEQRGIGLAELGDVVGRLAAAELRDALMQVGEIVLDRREHRFVLRGPQTLDASLVQPDPPAFGPRSRGQHNLRQKSCQVLRARSQVNDGKAARRCAEILSKEPAARAAARYFLRKRSRCTTSAGGRDMTT